MKTVTNMATNSKLFVIALDFQQHTAGAYHAIHHKLNAHYSGIIHDIDNLFSANRADLPAMITAKVINHMNLPMDADVTRFNQMNNSGALTLQWLTYEPETYSSLYKLTANTNIHRIRIKMLMGGTLKKISKIIILTK